VRRADVAILVSGLMLLVAWPGAAAAAVEGAETPAYAVTFPDDWVVEELDVNGEPLRPTVADERPAITVVARAYPAGRTEECVVVDLHAVAAAFSTLGVSDQTTLDRVAVDILDHSSLGTTSSGLGYQEAWSSWFEGTAQDGEAYALFSYLGRDAWPGLEDEWLVLDCRSNGTFHQDWRQIAQTLEFQPPPDIVASTGPVVSGGRIELPTSGFALVLPDGWVAADLAHPELSSSLQSISKPTRWFAETLAGSFGQSLDDRAAAGEDVQLWAWLPEDGSFWQESCDVTVEASPWESIDQLVDFGAEYVASDPEIQLDHTWAKVDLPAGEFARHDFRWSPTAAGSEYIFLDADRRVSLSCQDTGLDDSEILASRDRWLSTAETFEFLPTEE